MAPAWVNNLPPHITLTSYQIERLETIRLAVGTSETEFHLHLRSHPECVKMLQRQQYRLARLAEPGKPNEYYLIVIVLQRLQTARIAGGDLFDLRRAYPDSVPLDDPSLIATVLQLIRNRQWITIDQLADAINEYEAVLPGDVMPDPRTSEARHQVTLILRESSIA